MNKHILLSIKPKIIEEITAGTKRFEFRKRFPNIDGKNISNRIVIYSSKPQMKIFGSFSVKHQYHSNFHEVMKEINASKEWVNRISNYITNKESCHALEIDDLKIYKKPLSLDFLRKQFNNFCPGQSYRFLDPDIISKIEELNGSL